MFFYLSNSTKSVKRCRCHERVGSRLKRTVSMLEHALGLRVNNAHQHGDTTRNDTDRLADNLITPLVSGKDNFP